MKKLKIKKSSTQKKMNVRWIVFLFLITFFLSAIINFLSDSLLSSLPMIAGLFILFFIILLGIIFDIFGLAVTTAEEAPFHSMASSKIRGSQSAIWLIRNAEKVASFCNDVIGDVAGIISGGAAAAIAVSIILLNPGFNTVVVGVLLTAVSASLTVGGKAMGKIFAYNNANAIVYVLGYILSIFGVPHEK